jgi:hypothetical protein
LNQANADMLMERFVRLSYKQTKSNQAFIEVAHYFDQGNYTQALQWFEKVNCHW